MPFRRTVRIISLLIFLLLLFLSIYPSFSKANLNLFLRMDPSAVAVSAISGRAFSFAFIPAITVLLFALLVGRVFCGYICPMGTTIDLGDSLLRARSKPGKRFSPALPRVKYYILFFLTGSSLLGVSFVFTGSPIALITRFYGLLIHPVISLLGHGALKIIQPAAELLDLNALLFAGQASPRFATQYFILAFFIAVLAFAKVSPRFWCRYICPSGAFMALLSRRPLVRRQVSESCVCCGECSKSCPMNAINEDRPEVTAFKECIVCHKCEAVCPVDAVSFGRGPVLRETEQSILMPSRRRFVMAGLAGFGTAAVSLTGLNSPHGKPGVGQVEVPGLIRPPGALPETDFLALCIRCGQCMISCPTNGLQPLWIEAGLTGLFSPELKPRRGACSPECNNCGSVCPTGAIRELPIHERIWAKIGTAVIKREKCLAWEHKKRCMVCDEVCPFGAVKFRYEPGNPVPVPEVFEERCAGCGYCEHHCPVQNEPAIIVTPMNALRLREGSFVKQGEGQGLKISLRHGEDTFLEAGGEVKAPGFDGPAPGFEEEDSAGPAQGFTDSQPVP